MHRLAVALVVAGCAGKVLALHVEHDCTNNDANATPNHVPASSNLQLGQMPSLTLPMPTLAHLPLTRVVDGEEGVYTFRCQSVFQLRRFDMKQLQPLPDSSPTNALVVLTAERIFIFQGELTACPIGHYQISTELCAYPEDFGGVSLDVGSTRVDNIQGAAVDEPMMDTACIVLSDCSDERCQRDHQAWSLCGASTLIDVWKQLLDDAYLQRNQINERLSPAIVEAASTAKMTLETASNAPDQNLAFSPCLMDLRLNAETGKEITKDERALMHSRLFVLDEISFVFAAGVIPFRPGKNSRSGASFFFSADRTQIAKRIRKFEMDSLWTAVHDGEYGRRLANKSSLLNPICLAFESKGDYWIVMKAETLPTRVKKLLPLDADGERSFFMDVKPAPLTSDRLDVSALFLREQLVYGRHISELADWGKVMQVAIDDLNFLEDKQLVDYSVLLHGRFFEMPTFSTSGLFTRSQSHQQVQWKQQMQDALRDAPGCTFDCGRPSPVFPFGSELADVTNLFGADNRAVVPYFGTYMCCCMSLLPGEVYSVRSPCALVNVAGPSQSMFRTQQSCGNLITAEKDAWHSYNRINLLPATKGRCIVGMGVFKSRLSPDLNSSSKEPILLAPEDLKSNLPQGLPRTTSTCAVACVSILDYLIPFSGWSVVESALLVPVYGAAKWAWYKDKMLSLLRCLARPPYPLQGKHESQFFEQAGVYANSGYASLCADVYSAYSERDFTINPYVIEKRIAVKTALVVAPSSA